MYIAIFCHCHTHSVISVNETAETESCIIVKYIDLGIISTSTEVYLNHTSPSDLDHYGYVFYLTRLRLLETTYLLPVHTPLRSPTPHPSQTFSFFFSAHETEMSMCNISAWMAFG